MQDEHKQLQRPFVFERKEFVGYMKRDLEHTKEQLDKNGDGALTMSEFKNRNNGKK